MDYPKNAGTMPEEREDRLSALPDGVLGHVLSFLGGKEAARAAVLSRRWRHAFANVHTLSFEQEEGSDDCDDSDFAYSENVNQSRNSAFAGLVDAAISCRRRCGGDSGGRDPGLRAIRVVFDSFHLSLADDVDRWLSVATASGGALEEIQLDARRQGQRPCARERPDWYYEGHHICGPSAEIKDESDGDDDSGVFRNPRSRDRAYRVPRWLLTSCAAAGVRTLCLGSCLLDLPADADVRLPSVETLTLRRIPDSGKDVQRLVSACPRLAYLTLDSCRRVRAVAVVDRRLRRLALRCCHGARLTVDASDLCALDYRGPVPDHSVLSFLGSPPPIVSVDIEFCGKMTSSEAEFVDLTRFLERFAGASWLRLGSSRLGAGMEMSKLPAFPKLPCLRKLELKGALTSNTAIDAVTRILEQTPNLEVLTLLILPDVEEVPRYKAEVRCDPKAALDVPGEPPVIPCLRDRVKEINVVHYQGRVAQRTLLKLLLRVATALDELYVVFPKGEYAVQSMLMSEIESWVVNRPVKVMFA
ncbi:hypothetical protein ACP70R_001896 [Stipagrostis hirtigluma subsp. patula]